jgi:hypothetical protein
MRGILSADGKGVRLGLLYGVEPADPATLATVAALLTATLLAAS